MTQLFPWWLNAYKRDLFSMILRKSNGVYRLSHVRCTLLFSRNANSFWIGEGRGEATYLTLCKRNWHAHVNKYLGSCAYVTRGPHDVKSFTKINSLFVFPVATLINFYYLSLFLTMIDALLLVMVSNVEIMASWKDFLLNTFLWK